MAVGGGPCGREDLKNLEKELSVGDDWFHEYGPQDGAKPKLYGFARFRALEEKFTEGLSHDDFASESWNIPMLRSLAIAHFYQSNFSACHDLLKKVTKMILSEELEANDLGLSLMVAECALARGGKDNIKEAVNDLMGFKTSVTMQNIMALDAELVRSGRYIGGLLLQYLAFRKETERERDRSDDERERDRSDERKRFVRVSLGRICYRLARAKRLHLHLTKDSLDCLVGIFTDLLKQLERFGLAGDKIQSYAWALCHNCLSWCHLSTSGYNSAAEHAEKGWEILDDSNFYGDDNPALRMLLGDLCTNHGIAVFRSEGPKRLRKQVALILAKRAVAAYDESDDHRNAEDDFMREAQPRGEWAERFTKMYSK